MTTTPALLWLGIHCPDLPLLAVRERPSHTDIVAVHDTTGGHARIVQASPAARGVGVHPGQALRDALAVAPALDSRPRHRPMEARLLERLAMTAYRYSHQVMPAGADTILLEVAGSRRLLGDTGALIERLESQLSARGMAVRTGSAVFPEAARMLARIGQHAPDRTALGWILARLPLAALELPADQHQLLDRCGLRTVGELLRVPPADRARRFGQTLNLYLDRLRGRQSAAWQCWHPPEHYRLCLELPAATAETASLLFVFRRAIDHLGDWLEVRDQALTGLHAQLQREDGGRPVELQFGLARPELDRERLLELVALKLDALRLTASVTGVTLSAETTSEHRPAQADLFSGHNRNDAWPALLNRLRARLGDEGLSGVAPVADHRPERAWVWTVPGTAASRAECRARPAWLLPEPRPCRPEQLRLEQGPERIEGGWWDGHDCRRDYWVARDHHGRRLWVFREHKPNPGWFLQGIFDQ